MDEAITGQISRSDLLKTAGLLGAGGALALGLPGRAGATHGGSHKAVYAQAYVTGSGLPTLLVQGSALGVPVLANGTPGVQNLTADPVTGVPGFGFDVDFGQAVAGNNRDKNKGRDTSWCALTFTQGAMNGHPPVNHLGGEAAGGQDAIRLVGTATDSADPASIGAIVRLNVFSGLAIDEHHQICLIRFFFGGFGPWVGRGLAVVEG